MDTLGINPGLDSTFPWLSQIAMAFQEYKWRGLIFTYKTQSSDLVTGSNPSLGTVIMSTDYNSVEEQFVDKRSMENYEYTTSSKPSLSFVHMVETAKNQTAHPTLYTRDGPPPANADLRLYDIGAFSIATQGMQTTDPTATIGELWVSYEIEFLKPRFDLDAGIESDTFIFNPAGAYSGGTTVNMFGTADATGLVPAPTAVEQSLGAKVTGGTSGNQTGLITFPADSSGKTFRIDYHFGGTGGSAAGLTFVVPTVNAYATIVKRYKSPYYMTQGSATATQLITSVYVQIGNIVNQNLLPTVTLTPVSVAVANWPQLCDRIELSISEVNGDLALYP